MNFSKQDGTKREAVSWKLFAAFFGRFLVILNVFVCNMLLQNAWKNHQTYVRKAHKHCPKIVPKPLQNRSWRGSGGHLGTTLEGRCFQDLMFDFFVSILGSPLGPVWDHFGHHFLMFFEMAFWWPCPPFGLPKHLQNETQKGAKTKSWNSLILCVITTLEPHLRVLKIIIPQTSASEEGFLLLL